MISSWLPACLVFFAACSPANPVPCSYEALPASNLVTLPTTSEGGGTMTLRGAVVALAAGVAIISIGAAPASALVPSDGLVYVDVGDATIAVDVTIAEGAQIAAERCGMQVDP